MRRREATFRQDVFFGVSLVCKDLKASLLEMLKGYRANFMGLFLHLTSLNTGGHIGEINGFVRVALVPFHHF